MDRQVVVDILNELLALERANLVARLMESTVFVSRLSVEDMEAVQRMAQACERHAAWLADAILQLGGAVAPHVADPQSADLHYQDLGHVRPRIIADRESLVRKYTLAAARLGAERQIAPLISRILEQHRNELTSLTPSGYQTVSAGA